MANLSLDNSAATLPLELTGFKSEAHLSRLLAFAVYLGRLDSINLTKVLTLIPSYAEFTEFETLVNALLSHHGEYLQAMRALKEEVARKFRMLVLIDLGGTLFFRTDTKDCGRRNDYKFKKY